LLKPILPPPSKEEPSKTEPSSVGRLEHLPSARTSLPANRNRLSKLEAVPPETLTKILDFDLETVAAGFADPEWVPQKITCVAWSWVGSEEVVSRIATSEGLFRRPERRRKMLIPLLEAIAEAEMLTGHNIIRFDLPVLNAECMRLGLPILEATLVQDTIRLRRTKGFKKGQDNLVALTGVPIPKLSLSWQEWQLAYEEKGWATVVERCVTDVKGHKLMRQELLDRGWLKEPVKWRP